MTDVFVLQKFLLLVRNGIRLFAGFEIRFSVKRSLEWSARHRRYRLVRRVQHKACNLFNRKTTRKVCRSLLIGKTPVLVRQQFAGFCKIFKVISIFFQYLNSGLLCPGNRFSVCLCDAVDSVFRCFLHKFSPFSCCIYFSVNTALFSVVLLSPTNTVNVPGSLPKVPSRR